MPRSLSELPGGVRVSDLVALGVLAEHLPPSAMDAALAKAGLSDGRVRLLPLRFTLMYVVALSLYRDVAYEEVLRCLLEGFRWLGEEPPEVATKGAVTQARARLGADAARFLFESLAAPMSKPETKGAWYRSWLTVAVDGSTVLLPDSQANAGRFGYANEPGRASYPLARYACLCETGTHAAFAAALRPYASGEHEMLRSMLGSLRPGMLLLADRGYMSYDLWKQCQATGADLLWRANSTWTLERRKGLPDGSWLADLLPPVARRREEDPVEVRVVMYRVAGAAGPVRLVTTVLDPGQAPAQELAELYAERWEVEGMFDEMKTHLKGRGATLRSKTPDLVEQEFWGFMLAHRALRSLMHEAALKRQLDPDEVSFKHTVSVVKRTLPGRPGLSPREG